jgi:hypothetical protein
MFHLRSVLKWLCGRSQRRRHKQTAWFRPSLECLEGRALPSVTLTQFVDRSGDSGLRVVENGNKDNVIITDDSVAGTTTVVADGVAHTFENLFADFDLQLVGKKDALTFEFADTQALVGRHLNVVANLGAGENHFTFNPVQANGEPADIFAGSDVNLNVLGHNGNDFVNISFDDILESRVNVNVHGIGGGSGKGSDVRDVITFGHSGGLAGIRNSSVDVNVDLGHGNTNFAFNFGADVGHIGAPDVAADFGPSTFNVNIMASARRQDVDNITLLATGEVNTGSTLNFNTNLGAGNNSLSAVFDANTFQVDDDGGLFINGPDGTTAPHSGGVARFNVQAGTGNDAISFQSIHQDHTIELSGTFDINILGGSAKDNIKVDFGGTGFTDDDPFEVVATNRAFRLRIDGGSGPDTIKVNFANAATATFAFDVAIVGGSKKNDITFIGTNPSGGTPTFGPGGTVFIDGGFGRHNNVDVFGNFPVEVVNADN